jgi:glycosyltransferase involved in cell wall biosynthesis
VRVLLVVFATKYTGAAATAEHCARALRAVDVDARLLFTAGRNLETRLAHVDWARADLVKERTAARILSNLRTLREAADRADVVICHLPHDQLLCAASGVHLRAALVRNVRHPRHLRSDPWHRMVGRRTDGLVLAFASMEGPARATFGDLPSLSLPVPLEDRFRPGADGASWRRRLQLDEHPVVAVVGKLAAGRGFELALEAAARSRSRPQLVVVGHGELQPRLELLAADLGIDDRVRWAGYQDDLPGILAAADLLLFTAPGSDWGHRAISEAQGCGVPVVAARVPGVEDLIEDGCTGRMVPQQASAVADAADELLGSPDLRARMAERAAAATEARRLEPVGRVLAAHLVDVVTRRSGSRAV